MEAILEGKGLGRRASNVRVINHTLSPSPLHASQCKQMGKPIGPGWRGGGRKRDRLGVRSNVWPRKWRKGHRRS